MNDLDLHYCVTYAVTPALQALFLATGGLLWMIWRLLMAVTVVKAAPLLDSDISLGLS